MAREKNGTGGSVYASTNPTMPGLVKIGHAKNAQARLKQLGAASGVPDNFELVCECRVSNPKEVEKALHAAFQPYRYKGEKKSEFYEIGPEQLIPLFKILGHKTGKEAKETKANGGGKKSNGRTNLREIGIFPGDVLTFALDDSKKAVVKNDYDIEYNGELTSLTDSAKQITGYNSISGPYHWLYKGKRISVLKKETKQLFL